MQAHLVSLHASSILTVNRVRSNKESIAMLKTAILMFPSIQVRMTAAQGQPL